VVAFYRQRLIEDGWKDTGEVLGGYGFHIGNVDLVVTPFGPDLEPSVPFSEGLSRSTVRMEVATPPSGGTFFAISIVRFRCFRLC
jgi:hypothetical protein